MLRSTVLATVLAAVSAAALPTVDLVRRDEPTSSQIQDQDYWESEAKSQGRSLCFIKPDADGGDDGPAIQDALTNDCAKDSLVVFPGDVYHINTPLTTTGLDNVSIHHFGRLLWSDDVDYWLTVTMPIGFQNQSTVWYFGGDNVQWDGHFKGTLDGNGQYWYDWAKSEGNLPHRPMMINWRYLTNSHIQRLNFVQAQMWTMATSFCSHVDFDDIYVNNTSTSQYSTLNTDGIDTIHSDSITLRRWSVTNGDDSVALKGNSTNISVYDSEFWSGQGIAIGSLGQYNGDHELVQNFYAKNITLHDTTYAIYLKTWGGNSNGYPPNGGGGGLGEGNNITIEDIVLDQGRKYPFFLWQCENYEGASGKDCDSSKFHFSDTSFKNVSGTMKDGIEYAGWFQCSLASGGCDDFSVEDFSVTSNGTVLHEWYCQNVNDHTGFNCTETET